ncbi:MAG: ribonuclease R [Pirellulales bacterium]|nr:ribonuclease R [Pirellulales bacterium]
MPDDLYQAILDHVNGPHYRAVKPRVLAKKLDVPIDDLAAFRQLIKRMVREGQLAFGEKHLIFPVMPAHPAAKTKGLSRNTSLPRPLSGSGAKGADSRIGSKVPHGRHITGIFRRAKGGFGFVRSQQTPQSAGSDLDVYIPEKNAGDAANGDLVRVRLTGKRGRMGRTEGRIVDVIERQTSRFVGTYFEQAGLGLVRVDGNIFSNPIYVGDPGARGAQPDDKVVLDIVRFPSHVRDGEGVLVQILGQRGQPGIDTLSIIHEFGLPGEFAEETLTDARSQAALYVRDMEKEGDVSDDQIRFLASKETKRRDLTDRTVITIDPVDARDFDDAISLELVENDHWRLGVHIADVSHFVQSNSPLDREAQQRGTSIYLPDRVIPMLPEIISNNLASLQPDQIRLAITAEIEFTPDGARVATETFQSAIKSCRRFTYEEVDTFLAKPKAWTKKLAPDVHRLLGQMHAFAMMLRQRRMRRGALELDMPEVKIDLDSESRVTGAHVEKHTESHQIIEEFMLVANEAVAEMLHDRGLLFLRRVHMAPDPRKLAALTDFVRELGLKTESLQNRFALQKLLHEILGDPRERAVHYAALRSMQRAVYSPEEEGHYALASPCYCHFTSPIRRYPDLTVHRLITAMIHGEPVHQDLEALLILGDHCSEREQRATNAERELVQVKLLHYLEDRLGQPLDGVVTGVENYGLYVAGIDLPAEGLVHIASLIDDYYRYDRASRTLTGSRSRNVYRLGDSVRVEVASVDIERRELSFRLVGHRSRVGKGPGKRGSKKEAPKKKNRRRVAHQHSRKPGKGRGPGQN